MSINDIHRLLTSTYIDWSNVLANPQFIRQDLRDGPCITWNKRVTRMLNHPIMISDVINLFDDGQYTFQVEDGSLIQIYYKYSTRNILTSARLAFYSALSDEQKIAKENSTNSIATSVHVTDKQIIDEQFLEGFEDNEVDEITSEVNSLKDGPVSWLRIDYDPEDSKGVLHHDCHMHFSAFPHSRFVVAGIPTPSQFIEFIMAFCYPELYKAHRLNERGQYTNVGKITSINASCFPLIEDIAFRQIAHFRIPVAINQSS